MKKVIILMVLFMLTSCYYGSTPAQIEQAKEQETKEQEEQKEESIYTVELTDTEIGMMERYQTETLSKYKAENNTYTIDIADKEKILEELKSAFHDDLMLILDNTEYLDDLYHSKDFQLFRVYFYDINEFDTFTTDYPKYLFEIGKIYYKFDGHNNANISAIYYKQGNDSKLQTYSSLLFD